MTVVFGLVDHDAARRERTLSRARAALAMPFFGTPMAAPCAWHGGVATILWTCASTAPLASAASEGASLWALGHFAPGEAAPVDRALTAARVGNAADAVGGVNGYYLACHVDGTGVVTVGTDVLGLFPLYVASGPDHFVFATEPRLLLLHPAVDASLSWDGLAGVLLQGRAANGHTLHVGVRRPTSGHAVRWRRDGMLREIAANPLVPSEANFGTPYAVIRRRVADVLQDAITRLLPPDRRVSLMLSGGIDSRLLAAQLHALAPARATGLVFGAPGDAEVRCARAVAQSLGMPTVVVDADFGRFPALFDEMVQREGCLNTLQDLSWPSSAGAIAAQDAPLMSGLHGDAVAGFSGVPYCFDRARGMYSWPAGFDRVCSRYGVPQADLAELVREADFATAVSRMLEESRTRFEALPGLPFQKSFLWGLTNRSRYHNGAFAFRLSGAAWPLQPFVDRSLLDLMLSVPLDVAHDRRLEFDTLIQDFPALARLRVDRNGVDDRPLLREGMRALTERVRLEVRRRLPARRDRWTYYRTYDIGNAGWQAIRARVEARRAAATTSVFDRPTLLRLLPPPATPIRVSDGIIDSAKHKQLLGLVTHFANG